MAMCSITIHGDYNDSSVHARESHGTYWIEAAFGNINVTLFPSQIQATQIVRTLLRFSDRDHVRAALAEVGDPDPMGDLKAIYRAITSVIKTRDLMDLQAVADIVAPIAAKYGWEAEES